MSLGTPVPQIFVRTELNLGRSLVIFEKKQERDRRAQIGGINLGRGSGMPVI